MSAFSCPGSALIATGSTIANLPAGAYYAEYTLAAGFENSDPGIALSFVNCGGGTTTVTVGAMFVKPFTTGAANPIGSIFAVTISSANPGAIAQVNIEFATLDGQAPGISQQ